MYYRSGTDWRCSEFMQQMLRFHSLDGSTALYCMKGHHGCHFETMMSNQKSDSISQCVFTVHIPAKFHPDPI